MMMNHKRGTVYRRGSSGERGGEKRILRVKGLKYIIYI
jgi:hypothetical protein